MATDFNIFVLHHRPFVQIQSELFTNIAPFSGLNMLSSDTGDNIAVENNIYAEFSTYYWVWKNDCLSKYIGFFHFRRFLSFDEERTVLDPELDLVEQCKWNYKDAVALMNKYDVLVPKRLVFGWTNVGNQYNMYHDPYYLDKTLEIIERKYPQYLESFNTALNNDWGYYCNMFVMKREIFDKYMTFIFDIFSELRGQMTQTYQPKVFAYLGERIFTCYIEYLKSVEGLKIKELEKVFITEDFKVSITDAF